MMGRGRGDELRPVPALFYGLAGAGIVAVAVALSAVSTPRPANALPAYAQQTGLACGRCHVNPAGGGPRNAFGKAFAANGHKLPAAKSNKESAAKSGNKPEKTKVATATTPAPAAIPAPSATLDRAQAHAISLRPPYYSLFLYDSCDYSDCSAGQ
jgi:hypothetical protein